MSKLIYREIPREDIENYLESVSNHNYEFINMYPVEWYTNSSSLGASEALVNVLVWDIIVKNSD